MDGIKKEFVGELRVLDSSNKKLQKVEVRAMNDKVNRNGWKYINLEKHIDEFRNIPILTAYLMDGKEVGDGHNFDIKKDPKTGKEYASFTASDAERIIGWVDKDANIRVETDADGVSWIVVTGYLWKWYAKEAVDKLLAKQGGMDVSVETLVTKEHKDGDVEVEEEYILLGITVLGNGVTPAVAGAKIQTLAELNSLRSNMEGEILKAASYVEQNEPKNKKTSTKGVKRPMPIPKRRLSELGANAEGYTCVGASEDGGKLAFLSTEGAACGFAFNEGETTVVTERIKVASAEVVFHINGEEVRADFEAVMENATKKINELEISNKGFEEANKNLQEKLADMVAKEKARRLNAAKAAMVDELNKRNENREENVQFAAEICKDLEARIANNEFTGMEDADGNWIGEKAIRSEVCALCMNEQTRMDAEAKKSRMSYIGWAMNNNGARNSEPTTVGEKLMSGYRE